MRNRDLHISGAGSYPGGEFDSVSISGSGKINGDIRCRVSQDLVQVKL